ncbi:AMP phosphorylase [Candidatus Woesearchaeota archaeon]|nr:MAG: AMP phosphorylase [Candidatus Woesearchaeota archaeon]
MKLRVKTIPFETGFTTVVAINNRDALRYDLHPGDRVIVETTRSPMRQCIAVVDITDGTTLRAGTLGLFTEVARELGVSTGDTVSVHPAPKPDSLHLIKQKMRGVRLQMRDFDCIVKDIVAGALTEVELTYFVCAAALNELSLEETSYLTQAIARNGSRYKTKKYPVADKHCIGGIPGNRTTLIVVPILAACGLTIPKTSSRAITSPAGTADTMEVLCNVSLTLPEMRKVMQRVGACITWGGAIGLAPADDKIIRIEKPLSLDVVGLMLSSVMAKKFSVSATHVLIDIPYGRTAKVTTKARAEELRQHFLSIGKLLGMQLTVVLTDGRQPIGNGVGPVLEARDTLQVLRGEPGAPRDLREKSLMLAGHLLEFVGHVPKGEGYTVAKDVLDTGKAWKKMQEIIAAQGAHAQPRLGRHSCVIRATKGGRVREIDNKAIAKLARMAGAPITKGAGIDLHKKVGAKVVPREPLYTAYADSREKLAQVKRYDRILAPYHITSSSTGKN